MPDLRLMPNVKESTSCIAPTRPDELQNPQYSTSDETSDILLFKKAAMVASIVKITVHINKSRLEFTIAYTNTSGRYTIQYCGPLEHMVATHNKIKTNRYRWFLISVPVILFVLRARTNIVLSNKITGIQRRTVVYKLLFELLSRIKDNEFITDPDSINGR